MKSALIAIAYHLFWWTNTYIVLHTMSDTYLLVKHMAAKHFSPGSWSIAYRSVISRAINGIALALHNIFWSFEFWQMGTKIFATHAWHWSVLSSDARPTHIKKKNRPLDNQQWLVWKIRSIFHQKDTHRSSRLAWIDSNWWLLSVRSYVHRLIAAHTNKSRSFDCPWSGLWWWTSTLVQGLRLSKIERPHRSPSIVNLFRGMI